MENLPSHRQLLTSLIQSLSDIKPPPSSSPVANSTSPLHAISQNHRHLLLTLHVLFPNQLLPAFDLLDRGLVTRLELAAQASESSPPPPSAQPTDRGDDSMTGVTPSDPPDDSQDGLSGTFLVKSLATTLTRRNRDVGLSSKRYLVHLRTWNCSCASFTLEAFPVGTGSALDDKHGGAAENTPERQLDWSFGGMSVDGLGPGAGDIPCCKHLLACLLVEKWPGLLQRYADKRTVSKEEMAGLVADT